MREVNCAELTLLQRTALDAASEAVESAYDPYSRFKVGAALVARAESSSGLFRIVTGSNVGNASYGLTICAERSAIVRANARCWRTFDCLAVTARSEDFDTTRITAPCGACRQMIYELSQIAGRDLEIVLATTKREKIVITSIRELLPLPFGPVDLGLDVSKYR